MHSFFPAVAQENKAEIAKCRLTLGGSPFFRLVLFVYFPAPLRQVEKCLIISKVKLKWWACGICAVEISGVSCAVLGKRTWN